MQLKGGAIHCVDGEIQNAVSFVPNKKAYLITPHNRDIKEKELKNICIHQAF